MEIGQYHSQETERILDKSLPVLDWQGGEPLFQHI